MSDEKRFLVDVGIKDLPFPMKVYSRAHPDGQPTVANITISARIMREFEARWIDRDIFPEEVIDIVDRRAVAPLYSFLTDEDQAQIIERVHSEEKTSVVVTDEVKDELASMQDITSYSVRCANFGMLRPYSTVLATEKSMWVPSSGWEEAGEEVFGL